MDMVMKLIGWACAAYITCMALVFVGLVMVMAGGLGFEIARAFK